VPTIFIPGITGRLYQQFAMTIAISVVLSAFNALTLSPALAGLLLRPKPAPNARERRGILSRFFDAFNGYFERSTHSFVRLSGGMIRKGSRVLVLLAACGVAGGFTFMLEDRAGRDIPSLASNLAKFLAAIRKRPEIGMAATTFLPNVRQEFVNVDRDKALKQGVPINDVYQTIQAYMGGLFVNYYNNFGRTWQVYVEAEAPYRSNTEYLGQF